MASQSTSGQQQIIQACGSCSGHDFSITVHSFSTKSLQFWKGWFKDFIFYDALDICASWPQKLGSRGPTVVYALYINGCPYFKLQSSGWRLTKLSKEHIWEHVGPTLAQMLGQHAQKLAQSQPTLLAGFSMMPWTMSQLSPKPQMSECRSCAICVIKVQSDHRCDGDLVVNSGCVCSCLLGSGMSSGYWDIYFDSNLMYTNQLQHVLQY